MSLQKKHEVLTQCLVRRMSRRSASVHGQAEHKRNSPVDLVIHKAGQQMSINETVFSQATITWSSTVISVPSVLSVFHFSVNVRPYSVHLYLVSKLPVTLVVSVLAEPELVNSFKGERESQPAHQLFTLRHSTPKQTILSFMQEVISWMCGAKANSIIQLDI